MVTYVGTELGFDFQYYIWLELQLQLSPFANVRLIKQEAEFEPWPLLGKTSSLPSVTPFLASDCISVP